MIKRTIQFASKINQEYDKAILNVTRTRKKEFYLNRSTNSYFLRYLWNCSLVLQPLSFLRTTIALSVELIYDPVRYLNNLTCIVWCSIGYRNSISWCAYYMNAIIISSWAWLVYSTYDMSHLTKQYVIWT